jgi:hypothetical protein
MAGYALALIAALLIACELLWMPVQASDSLGELLDAQDSPSIWSSFSGALGTTAYLRPLRIAQIKGLFDLAQGRWYWLVFRGFHALLLIAAAMLFVRALRISTTVDFAASSFALLVLVGLYTFRGLVREAFPINHFLETVVACLVALNLAQSRQSIWIDVGAALTFVAAALTLESGLLVWVVAAAAWLAGWRGISLRGIAVMTTLLIGYFAVRFMYLSTGVPALSERSAGYLLDTLEPAQLQERFGARPLLFYGYNVAASVSSVLFSEPQDGVFEAVVNWLTRRPLPRVVIPVATSVVTTALLGWVAVRRIRRAGAFDDTARMLIVFLFVLAGNAALSFAYAQDEIMSVAGVFYALAAFGAIREALLASSRLQPVTAIATVLVLTMLGAGWAVRVGGVHFLLRSQAIKQQVDWVELPGRWQREHNWPEEPAAQQLILQLRRDAVRMTLPNTLEGGPEWPDHLWLD